jgi:YHS domain-containing protein
MSEPVDNPFNKFATAHLLTDVERDAFWALAHSLQRVWTAGGLAREAKVSDHEADQALRRFKAAGIVELLDEGCRPRRYRWRPEMDYLHDTSEPTGRRDPVCGMPVPAYSPHLVDHDGRELGFCSLRCLVRWRSEHRAPNAPDAITIRPPAGPLR